MDPAAFARLRPMMPLDALAQVLGKAWKPPSERDGRISCTAIDGFSARMEVGGRIGEVGFYRSFPNDLVIEGLHIGMPIADALAARPTLSRVPNTPDDRPEWSVYRGRSEAGHDLTLRVLDDAILALLISEPGVVFPEPPKLLRDPGIDKAYDLIREPPRPQPATHRGVEWAGGWSYGLPPGITPEQWPLSPSLGHPLRHAFTLHVPAVYRRRGADLVALTVFVDDQLEGLSSSPAVKAFFAAPLAETPPQDAGLLPLWAHRRARHPRQFDMTDVLGTAYAAIWLTGAEFAGRLCPPPDLAGNPLLPQAPGWPEASYAAYFRHAKVRNPDDEVLDWPPGEGRAGGLDTAFPIRAIEREGDPNVGRPAREWEHECADSGYVRPFTSEQGEALNLARFYGRNHLGGTMFPVQGYPEFGPCYLEFEEDFGGFNFGGGNGQIDLEAMKIDWACG